MQETNFKHVGLDVQGCSIFEIGCIYTRLHTYMYEAKSCVNWNSWQFVTVCLHQTMRNDCQDLQRSIFFWIVWSVCVYRFFHFKSLALIKNGGFYSAWLGHAQTLVLQMFVLLFCYKQSVQRQSQKFSVFSTSKKVDCWQYWTRSRSR